MYPSPCLSRFWRVEEHFPVTSLALGLRSLLAYSGLTRHQSRFAIGRGEDVVTAIIAKYLILYIVL